jgi:hypothetical protein
MTNPKNTLSGWISVDAVMPKSGRKVLVFYRNVLGNPRVTCAHYAAKHTLDASHWDDDCKVDYDGDDAYEPPGWWEEPTEVECLCFISDTVTHWMPLPEPPGWKPR